MGENQWQKFYWGAYWWQSDYTLYAVVAKVAFTFTFQQNKVGGIRQLTTFSIHHLLRNEF